MGRDSFAARASVSMCVSIVPLFPLADPQVEVLRKAASRQVAHAAMALCDATVMAGVQLSEKLEALLLAACLRIAAANEGGPVPAPAAVEELIDFPGLS